MTMATPQMPVNLTVADALGCLAATVKAAEAKITEGQLDEDGRRNQKALICIEARSAYTCYKDFLRWRAAEPWATDKDLLRMGSDLREEEGMRTELRNAVRVLGLLGANEDDDYLKSVQEKSATLNH